MGDKPAPPASGYVTIAEAAEIIGGKPWDVVRLIDAGQVSSVQLVDVESLRRLTPAAVDVVITDTSGDPAAVAAKVAHALRGQRERGARL